MKQGIRRYRDHVIELRPRAEAAETTKPGTADDLGELLIDDEPVGYGRLADGSLFLAENAYEWGDDLGELAEKLIDYRDQVSQWRGEKEA
jgi:hypothetical protein